MEEQKNKLTDRQLTKEMQKGKRGGAGGKLLIGLGAIVVPERRATSLMPSGKTDWMPSWC